MRRPLPILMLGVSLGGILAGLLGLHYATQLWHVVVVFVGVGGNAGFAMHWIRETRKG